MGRGIGFLETAVARRMLASFLLASLLPAALTALAGLWYVRQTVEHESQERVARNSKAASLVLMGRLAARAAELTPESIDPLGTRDGVSVAEAARAIGVKLRVDTVPRNDARIRLVQRSGTKDSSVIVLQNRFFWSPIDELIGGEDAAYCVFIVTSGARVRCSPGLTAATIADFHTLARQGSGGEVRLVGDSLMSAQNDLYLRDAFGAESWRLIVGQPTEMLHAANGAFTRTLVILLALGLVTAFTFAHRQIRVGTEPLRILRDATRRIREGELDAPVTIGSGDEFRELGEAFNHLSAALHDQVRLLRNMDAIDSAALTERRSDAIVERAAQAFAASGDWGLVTVGHVDPDAADAMTIASFDPASGRSTTVRHAFDGTEVHEGQFDFPLLHAGARVGHVRLASRSPHTPLDRAAPALLTARRIADRVALALGNVHLVARLEALSAGTLRAFARTIDANSPWTAGHSERVTHLALAIGRQLGLDEMELGRLYRGGLLHDIGKVAVPAAILDKPGKLTPEERAVVERHPGVGADILTPIPGFADVLPIVRSHHERIDGAGYPDGLAGAAIPWLARVLAVADVYDALTSDRPYRAGMTHGQALRIMVEGTGTWLDASVLDAFRAMDYDLRQFDVPHDLATQSSALEPPVRRELSPA
ncbi:MAG: HD domain-containing protein [Gemmatimonadetes bacterium]|nr:HD domain-containing protein [Gemmatimonadota bacterium]